MLSNHLKMDDIDRSIIQIVQDNPSLTHTQIAKKVNRSQPTVGMRIRKLEERGLLKFQAGINLKKLDLCLARVELQAKNPDEIFKLTDICKLSNSYKLLINICLNLCYLLSLKSQVGRFSSVCSKLFYESRRDIC